MAAVFAVISPSSMPLTWTTFAVIRVHFQTLVPILNPERMDELVLTVCSQVSTEQKTLEGVGPLLLVSFFLWVFVGEAASRA